MDKLEEKKVPPKTIEKVRENAEAAFKELEKAENTYHKKHEENPSGQQQLQPKEGAVPETKEENQKEEKGGSSGTPADLVSPASQKAQGNEGGKGTIEPAVRKIRINPDSSGEANQETSGGERK